VPTNKQRREAARRHLERQLQRRQEREAARKRFTLVTSIVGTLVLIAAIVVVVVLINSGSDHHKKKPTSAGKSPSPTSSVSPSPTAVTSTTPAPIPVAACAAAPKTGTATFRGLTVTGALDLKKAPKVTGKSPIDPKTVECEDLVVGKGAPATTASTVTVQYVGVVYKTGKVFQSSWTTKGAAPSFPLAPGSVIDGFSQGIVGAGPVAPMRAGGRRVIIMPAAEAYGANPQAGSGIPANAALVFIVDLTKVAATPPAGSPSA
jgi:peptidylprolyl isomerase